MVVCDVAAVVVMLQQPLVVQCAVPFSGAVGGVAAAADWKTPYTNAVGRTVQTPQLWTG